MKKMLLVQTALLVNIAICLTASAAGALAPSGQRELLVKWKDGPESHAAVVGNTHIGSIVKRNFNALGWQLVHLPEGMRYSPASRRIEPLELYRQSSRMASSSRSFRRQDPLSPERRVKVAMRLPLTAR